MKATIKTIWVIGGGTIGCGWAATFSAAGYLTYVIDPAPEASQILEEVWQEALPTISKIGVLVDNPSAPKAVSTFSDAGHLPDFVQEALPENLPLKQQMLGELELVISKDVVIASSSSGISPSDIQSKMEAPQRLVIGHPCNPPYLMPVVEICAGNVTSPSAMDAAKAMYEALGKTVLALQKEMPGHLINRLQSALWREAVYLAGEGVASVGDIEAAVTKGLGARWAVLGPTSIFHLAGGDQGLEKFFDDLAPAVEQWWASLGSPSLDHAMKKLLIEGMQSAANGRSPGDIAQERDTLVPQIIQLLKRNKQSQLQGGT